LFSGLWAFLRRLEVMVLHVVITDDIVIDDGVLSGTEVPGLLLGVVWAVL